MHVVLALLTLASGATPTIEEQLSAAWGDSAEVLPDSLVENVTRRLLEALRTLRASSPRSEVMAEAEALATSTLGTHLSRISQLDQYRPMARGDLSLAPLTLPPEYYARTAESTCREVEGMLSNAAGGRRLTPEDLFTFRAQNQVLLSRLREALASRTAGPYGHAFVEDWIEDARYYLERSETWPFYAVSRPYSAEEVAELERRLAAAVAGIERLEYDGPYLVDAERLARDLVEGASESEEHEELARIHRTQFLFSQAVDQAANIVIDAAAIQQPDVDRCILDIEDLASQARQWVHDAKRENAALLDAYFSRHFPFPTERTPRRSEVHGSSASTELDGVPEDRQIGRSPERPPDRTASGTVGRPSWSIVIAGVALAAVVLLAAHRAVQRSRRQAPR